MSSTVANNIAQCFGALVKFGKFKKKDLSTQENLFFYSWYIYNDD